MHKNKNVKLNSCSRKPSCMFDLELFTNLSVRANKLGHMILKNCLFNKKKSFSESKAGN